MKIVMINAATLTVYRNELATRLLNAVTGDTADGEGQRISQQQTELFFHSR
ncbi:hypothetical protein [Erwinia psidii]|uniref:hypothetical protein n=1 Tax=Erwinia psidii TaxID=69224 RepID=UPI0013153A38|nr:hypothetical protein [Erwinia psidii]